MALNAKDAKGSAGPIAEPLEAGTYPARLVSVVDIGLQAQNPFKGQEKPPVHKIITTYELSDEFLPDEDGNDDEEKPRWMSEELAFHNLSQDRAKSTIRYKSVDPNMVHEGDWTALLNTPVSLTIVQNPGKGSNAHRVYNNVAGVSPMRDKDAKRCPPLVNKEHFFDLDNPDLEIFNALPQWIQKKIRENLEFAGSPLQKLLGDKDDTPAQNNDDVDMEEELDDEVPY